jgi:hypothetical protein
MVGSWARHEATMESDLDIVVLTDQKQHRLDDEGWIGVAVGEPATVIRRMKWGPLTERRVVLASGFEVELGLATLSWASTDPLDEGTAGVVRDGCLPLVDPDGILAQLVRVAR